MEPWKNKILNKFKNIYIYKKRIEFNTEKKPKTAFKINDEFKKIKLFFTIFD